MIQLNKALKIFWLFKGLFALVLGIGKIIDAKIVLATGLIKNKRGPIQVARIKKQQRMLTYKLQFSTI